MSYQSDIIAAIAASEPLVALVGDRVFWDVADGSAVAPYLVLQTISGDSETTHDGDRRVSMPLIQVTCWASGKITAIAVMQTWDDELAGREIAGASDVSLVYAGEQSTRDQDTKLFGEIREYRAIHHTN